MNTDGIPTSYVNMSKDYYYGSREKKKKVNEIPLKHKVS